MVSDDHLSSRQLSSSARNSMLNPMVIDESQENTKPKHTGYAHGELNKHETFTHQLLNKDITCHSQYTVNVGSEIVNEIERSTENVSGNQQCVFSQPHSNVNTLPIRSEPSVRDTNRSDDDILWLKLAADKLQIDKDFYVGLCYVVPDDSSRQSINTSNIFDR
ncbi:hypothetical protein ACF0H5_023785 [Mactra antiquata]